MFEVCCRLCLEQVPLSRVQSLYDKHREFTIRDKISELFQIKFSDTEKLSTVCNDCLDKIETADKIRAFFLESDERFRRIMLGCEKKEDNRELKDEENSNVAKEGVKTVAETDDDDYTDVKMEPSNSVSKTIVTNEQELATVEQDEEEHLFLIEDDPEEELREDSPNLSISVYDESVETVSEQKPESYEEGETEVELLPQEEVDEDMHDLSENYTADQDSELEDLNSLSKEVVELDEVDEKTVSIGVPGDEEFSIVSIEYQCNVCNEVFEDRVSLIRHMNSIHIQQYPKNCRHCLSVYKTNEELQQHDCVLRPRRFTCSQCNASFQSVKKLQDHIKVAHRVLVAQTDQPQPAPHRSKSVNQCHHCPKSFANNRTLLQHVQTVHPDDTSVLSCDRCVQQFANALSLQAHISAHEKNYECRFCGKVCPTAVALAGHENTHTKDQPFQCCECGRNFAQYTSMRRHMKIHFDEKAYQCDICPKRFRQRSVMLTHRRIHTGEKPFTCTVCRRSFRDHSTLAKHKRVHGKGGAPAQKS